LLYRPSPIYFPGAPSVINGLAFRKIPIIEVVGEYAYVGVNGKYLGIIPIGGRLELVTVSIDGENRY
jgi:hypothetical protein